MINEAIEDQSKDIRERKDILKSRLVGFYQWMLKEAPRKDGGKGYTPKQATQYNGAVRSFYATYDLTVKMKGISRIPNPKVTHKRQLLSVVDVKQLIDFTTNLRDKAIWLVMFQGGLDVSTVCSINYGQVERGLDSGESPLKIDLYREKSGTQYYTFIGRDAIEAIEIYLTDLKSKGIVLSSSDPLFLKDLLKSKERIETNLIQKNMKEVAVKAGLIPKELASKIERVNPHALRESFGSIMASHGMPSQMVNFLIGHSVGELGQVYQRYDPNAVREEYAKGEIYLSINLNGGHLGAEVGELKEMIAQLKANNERMRRDMISAVTGLQMHVNSLSRELGKEAPYSDAEELEKQQLEESKESAESAKGLEKQALDETRKRLEE